LLQARNVLKIVIPTINSASYLDLILSYYRSLQVPVSVFVDSKSLDHTSSVAAQYADEVISFNNPSTRVGEMIEGMSLHYYGAPWVLRIDDDELPSIELLRFVARFVSRWWSIRKAHAVGFRRYQCAFDAQGKLLYSPPHSGEEHRQWRLYRPAKVRFHGRGHSPGFDFNESRALIAPPSACLIHLDWIIHSAEERKKKLLRYDAHTPGHGESHSSYYLADQTPNFRDSLIRFPSTSFQDLIQDLLARYPPSASAFQRPPASNE